MNLAIAGIAKVNDCFTVINEFIRRESRKDIYICTIDLSDTIISDRHYDVILFTDRECEGLTIKPDIFINNINYLLKNILPSDICIVNIDDSDLLRHLAGLSCHIITYGFSSKASLTASSAAKDIMDSSYLFCLQNSIKTYGNVTVDPCEIKMTAHSIDDIYALMGACAVQLIL